MKIKKKITLVLVSMGVISAITASLLIGWISTNLGEKALENSAKDQLISIREIKKSQIEDYFQHIKYQVMTFSNDRMIIDAMQEFNSTFHSYTSELITPDYTGYNDGVKSYYTNKYLEKYKQLNNGSILNVSTLMGKLDNEATALQYRYIQDNPNPLGSKDELVETKGGTSYEDTHKKYHTHIRDYLRKFEYYDIFLVDAFTGDIVYSVFKELDYATSLIDGPYANSGLAEAFNAANAMSQEDGFVLTDFKPYAPSYEYPASFIASPIFENGIKVGILIFQIPISKIDKIMTYNQQWKASGLGETGETYLVAADLKMRSQGRFMIEDKTAYIRMLENLGYEKDFVDVMEQKETTIGLQTVDTAGVRAVLKGETGFNIFPNYRGVSVLSAFAPVNIQGMDWAIMSEIDEAEAFAPIEAMVKEVLMISFIVIVCVIGLSIAVGVFVARSISNPISKMVDTVVACVKDITDGEGDLTFRLDDTANDEMGNLAKAINHFIEVIQAVIREFGSASFQVASAAKQMKAIVSDTSQGIERQFSETEQVATAMNEMVATAQEVAKSASDAAVAANEADGKTNAGLNVVNNAISSIETFASEIEMTTEDVNSLQGKSESIGSVLDVIRDIADQTNLLALNAAIEAARAGEQGRGFAVVADEVRTLASRTQASTREIQTMIENLQAQAQKASKSMKNSCEHANESVNNTKEAGVVLDGISDVIANIDSLNTQIATAAEEQTAVAEEINKNIFSISDIGRQTSAGAEQISIASEDMTKLAEGLQAQVGHYKV